MATQPRSSDKTADPLNDAASAPIPAVVTASAPASPPRLGDAINVRAAPERVVHGGARGRFTDQPEPVTVTLRVLRLLQDGDLVRV